MPRPASPPSRIDGGYYRFPTIHQETVVFVSENDLWRVSLAGGAARRLTSSPGTVSRPRLSPDGKQLAFISQEEGQPEVYLAPAEGGPAERLTFFGAHTLMVGWTPDGKSVIFASNQGQPFERSMQLYEIPATGGHPQALPYGLARTISHGPKGRVVLGRHTDEIAHWKRYRGGRAGVLWVDAKGKGEFKPLIELPGNLANPMWIGKRIYFASDHEGVGNLYSCLPSGKGLQRHSDNDEYYLRNPSTDGSRIVYHAAAELYCYDPAADSHSRIEIDYHSPRVGRNRKFVSAARHLESYALHPSGDTTLMICRGKPYGMAHWEGAVRRYGEPQGVRYRHGQYLHGGEHLLLVSDQHEREEIEVHSVAPPYEVRRLEGLDLGRTVSLSVSPMNDHAAVTNHRNELLLVDVEAGTIKTVDRSDYGRIQGVAWSPDGRWLAYGIATTQETCSIKIYELSSEQTHQLTPPSFRDVAPEWDPEGKYLYFLSYRVFDPVYDNQFFELSFPRGMKPYLITLKAETASPFVSTPRAPGGAKKRKIPDAGKAKQDEENGKTSDPTSDLLVEIDLEQIQSRIRPFPVKEGKFEMIRALPGKVLFSRFPIEGSLARANWRSSALPAKGQLDAYNFEKQEIEVLVTRLTSFEVSADRKVLIYQSGRKLRVVRAGDKAVNKEGAVRATRESGWLGLHRIKLEVDPAAEWRQMFDEAWRLQRAQFWTEDMSRVDWEAVRARYTPLLDRVSTRREFSDLIWEMQGELGTSHAYEMGGDQQAPPHYRQGHLGIDIVFERKTGRYRIERVLTGDTWDPDATSPLTRPGVNVQPGETLLAIGGREVTATLPPMALLVNHAGEELELTIGDASGKSPRNITVKTLKQETPTRYREWVEANRQRVLDGTDGQAGYIHIPNMGPLGFSEFHRAWASQLDRYALIVDVRNNGGGHVSSLILEKLARKRIGYNIPRWGPPTPYPGDSIMGPMVALTNENAGSDGDIFSHCFKLMKLGPLVGRRTWGGVVGIWPRHRLVDGGITTQPEFSFWFHDVGWNVENYGTEPDIDIDITPQDYAAGKDPQLATAIEQIQKLCADNPQQRPEFNERPNLTLPKLPPRSK